MIENRFIISALRKIWLRDPNRNQCLKNARVSRGCYCCNVCKKIFSRNEVHIDHISPIGKFINWDIFIMRLFCNLDNLQVLCKDVCHKQKSKLERDGRRK